MGIGISCDVRAGDNGAHDITGGDSVVIAARVISRAVADDEIVRPGGCDSANVADQVVSFEPAVAGDLNAPALIADNVVSLNSIAHAVKLNPGHFVAADVVVRQQ